MSNATHTARPSIRALQRRAYPWLHRALVTAALLLAGVQASAAGPTPPSVGAAAPNFTLQTLDDKTVELRQLASRGTVVLLVLRGWPGYQCPLCTRQVRDFAEHASEFAARGAQVVMLYPGPSDTLRAKAREFLRDKDWPATFTFVLDPDYAMTRAYGLRWDAKGETAYPSTFIIERGGRIQFTHVSRTHGDRTRATDVLANLNTK